MNMEQLCVTLLDPGIAVAVNSVNFPVRKPTSVENLKKLTSSIPRL